MNPFGEVSDSDVLLTFMEDKHQIAPINYSSVYDDPNYICIQLPSSTQDDFSSPQSTKHSIDLRRKKNREAAKRSRQKKKQSIINLLKENQFLSNQLTTMKSEMERKLCYDCKCQMNLQEMNIEEENTLSNSPSVSFTKEPSLVFFTALTVITMIGLITLTLPLA